MDRLKEKFYNKASALKAEIKSLVKENGDRVIGEVNLAQVIGGARGIKTMMWETSQLDAYEGIRFRGFSIPQLRELLPTWNDGKEPLPEGLFWLMLVDEIPTEEEVQWLTDELEKRAKVPDHTFKAIDALPTDTHPMTQFTIGISSMQTESLFAENYTKGMGKDDYWDSTYEDTMNLIARIPQVAAYIYRRLYFDGDHIAPDESLDWAGNFAHMLGYDNEEFKEFMRLYLTIHADHEGGNASAHTVHLVNSTLADVYLSFAAGLNSLAGPLHGLANQEVIKWINQMVSELGTSKPTNEQVRQYISDTLAARKVVPGYGHAVLRQPDPRYVAQKKFAKEHIKDNDIVNIVWQLFDIVPELLKATGKVKNPWPNVDAHSGAILVHYGFNQYTFYTVLFGVSRALGVLSAACWSRALGLPLERPKSVTSGWIKEQIS